MMKNSYMHQRVELNQMTASVTITVVDRMTRTDLCLCLLTVTTPLILRLLHSDRSHIKGDCTPQLQKKLLQPK